MPPLSISRRSLDGWPNPSSNEAGDWPATPGAGTPANGNAQSLNPDLSSIHNKNVGLVKRDKIALFDKECSKVAQQVYLGSDAAARDRETLKRNGITHVLNCICFVCLKYLKSDFVYRTLWLKDTPSEDITSILYDVLRMLGFCALLPWGVSFFLFGHCIPHVEGRPEF